MTIYENKNFNIIFKLTFGLEITSVIQLNNNDIIVLARGKYANIYIYIYRLINNKYDILQHIIEDRNGYALQKEYSGCLEYEKEFQLEWIKKLSKNKFMTISNYGFKIYSLNEKNEYSIILINEHYEGIEMIHEINENKFIFCTDFSDDTVLGGPAYNQLIVELIELEKITEEKIKKEQIKSLKFSEKCQQILYHASHLMKRYFSDCIILKNRYFVILLDYIYRYFNF